MTALAGALSLNELKQRSRSQGHREAGAGTVAETTRTNPAPWALAVRSPRPLWLHIPFGFREIKLQAQLEAPPPPRPPPRCGVTPARWAQVHTRQLRERAWAEALLAWAFVTLTRHGTLFSPFPWLFLPRLGCSCGQAVPRPYVQMSRVECPVVGSRERAAEAETEAQRGERPAHTRRPCAPELGLRPGPAAEGHALSTGCSGVSWKGGNSWSSTAVAPLTLELSPAPARCPGLGCPLA